MSMSKDPAGSNSGCSKKDQEVKKEDGKNIPIYQGRCKWFNRVKGFGFLTTIRDNISASTSPSPRPSTKINNNDGPCDDDEDVFFYYTAIQMDGFRTLHPNQRVRFKVRHCDKGTEAIWIEPLDPSPEDGATFVRDKLIKCYNCGKFGHHRAINCHADQKGDNQTNRATSATIRPSRDLKTTQNGQKKNYKKQCFKCRSNLHLASECPTATAITTTTEQTRPGPRSRLRTKETLVK